MIELYVFLTLAAVGYMINKNSTAAFTGSGNSSANGNIKRDLPLGELPNAPNIYQSSRVDMVKKIEEKKAAKMAVAAEDPKKSRVIPRIKSLTGEYVEPDQFLHNNMMPYFGRSVRQNLTESANNTLMENYTGGGSESLRSTSKCEAKSFYDVSKNVGNVYGNMPQTDALRDHIVLPRVRNNEFPIDQVRVAPGLGKGYGSEGAGGFQQFEMRDYVMPKTVDELRTATKPKETFEGRMVDGLKTNLPGDKRNIGEFNKNRAETFYQQDSDRWFVTTGANLKQSAIPEQDIKDTNRQDTSRTYIGSAVQAEGKARQADSKPANKPLREQHGGFGVLNPTVVHKKLGLKDDYGKNTIMVYNNERQITGARVYQGNITSLVKNIVAPLVDAVKVTKKDGVVNNPRQFGNAAPQIPDKLTVYDPNGIARTTIKETLLHDDTFRGTIKGTAAAALIYDPSEISAKLTIRETLKQMAYEMNLNGGAKKATVYDPDDKTRTTMKETLIDNERDTGNVDNLEGGGAYETTEFSARNTLKQFTSLYDHYGGAALDMGAGHLTNPHEAPNTQKQYTSDYDYYGVAGAADKKEMSKENIANARVSVSKELLLKERVPTTSGAKVYTTADDVNLEIRKDTLPPVVDSQNRERVYQVVPTAETVVHMTRGPKEVEHIDDRLDPVILSQLRENPYAVSIGGVAK